MILAFVSNMLNHHQIQLCREFQKVFDEFYFIVTEPTPNIGYQQSQNAEYVLRYYDSKEKEIAEREIVNADVVIFGGCPDNLIELRMRENKLSFLYSERFWKKGTWRRWIPITRRKIHNRIVKYKGKNMYVLCASAYLPLDLSLMRFPNEKCFKWGYFPKQIEYTPTQLGRKTAGKIKILWTGRMLDWKHPEMAIRVAERLRNDGYDFVINMIGNGELYSEMQQKIKKLCIHDKVRLIGSLSPDEVRNYMLDTNIFLATSDFYEGWGAVVNEAMNSGCAVVASHAMGSVPYLIQNGKNGMVYHSGNVDELYEKVKYLLNNHSEQKRLGKSAYETIVNEWNADVAADRLFNLSEHLLAGEKPLDLYQTGPCSKAEIIKDNWF